MILLGWSGRTTLEALCAPLCSGAKHIRRISSRADSYCKPEQYGQCAACETLERQLRQRDGRYAGIMAGWKSCNIRCKPSLSVLEMCQRCRVARSTSSRPRV